MPDPALKADAPAAAPPLGAECLWFLPFALTAGWMMAATEMMWPRPPKPTHHTGHDPQEQLVVPDPIEDTGEHALFA
jgi:hypothetical protein